MAVETNARIEFSVASVEEWEKVNPKLHQGEPVFAKKPSGKYVLKVGAPGGSTYKNAVVVWDQDDAETKMTSTQEAAAQALASKNAAASSASAAKTSETAAAASKSAAATSAANAKTSETNATASKVAASNSASIASAKATAAGNSASAAATSEMNAAKSARAAATSETNALSSASAASTSAGNAKISETNASASASNAANSAKAAKQSEQNAKTWDPTSYTKSIILHKPDNSANNVCFILGEIPNYYTYNNDRAGGSFSIYPYVRVGLNPQMNLSPAYCSIAMPYNLVTNEGYVAWSTNANYVPVIIKNNETNKVYWGLSVRGPGYSAIIFGAFEHDINVITTLLSSSVEDIYDGWTILKKAEIKDPAGNDALFKYLHRIGTNPTLPTTNKELTALGVFMSYYWHNIIAHQPTTYGQIINLPTDSSNELAQLWIEQTSGRMYHRGGNTGTPINDVPFIRFLDEDDATKLEAKIPTKISQLTDDVGIAKISNGHLVINGSELWIE